MLSLSLENMSFDKATHRDNVKCPESLLAAKLAAPSQDFSFPFILFILFLLFLGPRDLHEATAWTRVVGEGWADTGIRLHSSFFSAAG